MFGPGTAGSQGVMIPAGQHPLAGQRRAGGLWHEALLCRGAAECVTGIARFIREGLRQSEPTWVAVSPVLGDGLRHILDPRTPVTFCDITELGRNPGRLIPVMLDFAGAHAGSCPRFVSEPVWAGRASAEITEAARHEALTGLAFADIAAGMLCVYNVSGLGPDAVGCAERTHPVIVSGGRAQASPRYAGTGVIPRQYDLPLPQPPASAARLAYSRDLRPVRALVARYAADGGLPPHRASDLTLAVSEVAANTLRHASGDGTLLAWRGDAGIVCQVTDSGVIRDPLAGRRRPDAAAAGQGLWVVNQLCDLVQLRSGPAGTTIRMHVLV